MSREECFGLFLSRFPIILVDSLGPNTLGLAKEGKIYLAASVFDRGLHYVCSTLLEEYIHLDTGLEDETRGLQTYLFDLLIQRAKIHSGEMF